MQDWKAHIDTQRPCWDGYRVYLKRLPDDVFPSPAELSRLILPGLKSAGGAPVRFRAASEIPAGTYEKHIYETGEVSTREDNWHDLFNALAWCRFPAMKAAMNAVHYRHLDEERDGRRGAQRDALTLLDESGAVVATARSDLLEALAGRDWSTAFVRLRDAWTETSVMICGHAILEKFLTPYKALTAHALFVPLDGPMCAADLDGTLARRLMDENLLRSTRDLSPLPLAGIPGWWPNEPQDEAFYADTQVFRPPR